MKKPNTHYNLATGIKIMAHCLGGHIRHQNTLAMQGKAKQIRTHSSNGKELAFVWVDSDRADYWMYDIAPNHLASFMHRYDTKFYDIFNKVPFEYCYTTSPQYNRDTVKVLSGRPNQRSQTEYLLVSEDDMRKIISITTTEGLVFLRPMIEQAFPQLLNKIDTYLLFGWLDNN